MAKKSQKENIWNKAKKIAGKDPKKYRRDPYGKVIYKGSFGKVSPMGWDMDHIRPKARGGSNATRNLQALSSQTNRSKGADMRKRSRHSKSNR